MHARPPAAARQAPPRRRRGSPGPNTPSASASSATSRPSWPSPASSNASYLRPPDSTRRHPIHRSTRHLHERRSSPTTSIQVASMKPMTGAASASTLLLLPPLRQDLQALGLLQDRLLRQPPLRFNRRPGRGSSSPAPAGRAPTSSRSYPAELPAAPCSRALFSTAQTRLRPRRAPALGLDVADEHRRLPPTTGVRRRRENNLLRGLRDLRLEPAARPLVRPRIGGGLDDGWQRDRRAGSR